MITKYDPSLAVVDGDWLNRVGTAYAVAYYKYLCLQVVDKINVLAAHSQALEAMAETWGDEKYPLYQALTIGLEMQQTRLEQELTEYENRLFAVNSSPWVDAETSDLAWQQIGNPTPITRAEFEADRD